MRWECLVAFFTSPSRELTRNKLKRTLCSGVHFQWWRAQGGWSVGWQAGRRGTEDRWQELAFFPGDWVLLTAVTVGSRSTREV